jgi:uncharacterized protein YqeY
MLYDKIIDDLKTAMLTKNNISRDCLKLIIAEIKNKNVLEGKDITDDLCLAIIKKSVKQHSDSIEQFTKANRNDLVEKEQLELNCLLTYLPKMLTENESIILINNLINDNLIEKTKKNFGKIMGLLNTHEYKDQVDKKFISKYLNTILN